LADQNVLNANQKLVYQLQQSLTQNKWLLVKLNGYTQIPPALSSIYLIITATRIILYGTCNTFYTNYVLNANQLTNINWVGTKLTCNIDYDSSVTSVIFYANQVSFIGSNLMMSYRNSVNLA
jgi:heat shock protein HslJ